LKILPQSKWEELPMEKNFLETFSHSEKV